MSAAPSGGKIRRAVRKAVKAYQRALSREHRVRKRDPLARRRSFEEEAFRYLLEQPATRRMPEARVVEILDFGMQHPETRPEWMRAVLERRFGLRCTKKVVRRRRDSTR